MTADEDLEDLYEHAPCGNLSTSPDGTIVKVNATLLSWLGLARNEVVGARFQDLLTMPARIFHDTHYLPMLALQGFAREIALDFQRAGGPLSTIISTVARRDASGRIVGYRSTIFDTSSRRSFERELIAQRRIAEQEAAARSALIAMLSHDIRSPLGTILMAADLLREVQTPEAYARFLDVVERAGRGVLDLVNAILDHSRLEAGAAIWDPQPVDLRALLREITSIHAVAADTKGVGLRTTIDDSIPERLLLDRFKFGQIVNNLVSNALKFTARGHVAIEVRALAIEPRQARLQLRVSDTGIGIPEKKLGTIFEEYKQASVATERKYGGSGLGLAIVRKLVELAGSTITVESTVGVGTTFTCELRAPIAHEAIAHVG